MILVCGEALIDLFVEAPVPERPAERPARAIAGGSPFNVAVGLARLGAPSSYLGGISRDSLGGFLVERLHAERVGLGWVKRSPAPTPLAVVSTGPDGQAAYSFNAEATAYLDLAASDLPPRLPDAVTALAFGSFALAVEPVGSALLALARREQGRRVISLDPNVRPALVGDLGRWRERIAQFAKAATLIKVSTEDVAAGWGEGADAGQLADAWLHGGAELVVVTGGSDGATAYHASGRVHVPGRTVTVIDTVGAGDTFHAALLSGLWEAGRLHPGGLAGLDAPGVIALVRRAVLASSLTCARRGADLPTRQELLLAEAA